MIISAISGNDTQSYSDEDFDPLDPDLDDPLFTGIMIAMLEDEFYDTHDLVY